MPSNKPRLMTYTTQDVIEKFAVIAENENRSMSKELEYIVKLYIQNYENQHGTISIKNINIVDNRGSTNNINM